MDLTAARSRIHAMLPICDNPTEAEARQAELDARLDALEAAVRTQAANYFEQRRPVRAAADNGFDRGRRATVGWVVEELRDQAATPSRDVDDQTGGIAKSA